jgi:preprotein translocase subunit SecG
MVFLIILHVTLCLALIGLVLLQQGKGAEVGATLGGNSNSLFGAGGATTFITRLTTGIAISFMVSSVLLVKFFNSSSSSISSDASNEAILEGSLLVEKKVIKEDEKVDVLPSPTVSPEVTSVPTPVGSIAIAP